ncbi:P-type conjugative transfer protein TrbJ, partial [Acidomonas methanolica]|nr:P-type conjugative transfer protein TrbJ [Acidomonas methanolica]
MKNIPTMKSIFVFGAVLVLPLALSASAHAQWAVYDAANHVQNVLTAARALQQVNQQAQSLL